MKQARKLLDQVVAKTAYETAKKNVNSTCNAWFYQSKLPDALKKLKEEK